MTPSCFKWLCQAPGKYVEGKEIGKTMIKAGFAQEEPCQPYPTRDGKNRLLLYG